jgi:hypothetical protein
MNPNGHVLVQNPYEERTYRRMYSSTWIHKNNVNMTSKLRLLEDERRIFLGLDLVNVRHGYRATLMSVVVSESVERLELK